MEENPGPKRDDKMPVGLHQAEPQEAESLPTHKKDTPKKVKETDRELPIENLDMDKSLSAESLSKKSDIEVDPVQKSPVKKESAKRSAVKK